MEEKKKAEEDATKSKEQNVIVQNVQGFRRGGVEGNEVFTEIERVRAKINKKQVYTGAFVELFNILRKIE